MGAQAVVATVFIETLCRRLLLYAALALSTLAVNRCVAWHVRPRPAPERLGRLV